MRQQSSKLPCETVSLLNDDALKRVIDACVLFYIAVDLSSAARRFPCGIAGARGEYPGQDGPDGDGRGRRFFVTKGEEQEQELARRRDVDALRLRSRLDLRLL